MCSIENQLLVLHVGPQLQVITLHSNLLPESTKSYIEARGVGEWSFTLPDVDFESLGIYRSWLYTRELHTIATEEEETLQDEDGEDVVADPEWTKLAHCYILGHTLHDECFSNAAISALIEKNDRHRLLHHWSRLRCLRLHEHRRQAASAYHRCAYVWRGLGWWIHEPHDDARGPPEFLADVAREYTAAGESLWEDDVDMPWEGNVCEKYHVHNGTVRCTEE